IDVLDAIAQIELSPAFNVWIGRMLTPADRIEMNGPFYGLSWNQYTVPLLPSDQFGQAGLMGRDDGVTVWGKVGRFQYSLGLSDGAGPAAHPGDFSATVVDFLYEQPRGRGAAVTFEAEYKTFDAELTPAALADPTCFCLFDGDAYFATFAYLLPGTGGSDSLS